MFWDKVANFYDVFANIYNGKVNRQIVVEVSNLINSTDTVLECACGTGMISKGIASICKTLVATDYSVGMLKKARKNCAHLDNISFRKANIMDIEYGDECFEKVVAGNVIHLLDEPYKALDELFRVCKKDGTLIIPTYISNNKGKSLISIGILEKLGVKFKKKFDFESYKEFYNNAGYNCIDYIFVKGKIPCAIAIIRKSI